MSEPFIGEIQISPLNFAPRGWAFCDGSLLPISQNTALFSIIGTTFGGDGRTTTALPDLRDRVPMHPGRGPGLSTRRLGARGGVENVTLTPNQMPHHTHTAQGSSDAATDAAPSNTTVLATTPPAEPMYATGMPVEMASDTLGDTGGGQAHNNLQPFLTVNFIIALTGVFPSRR